MTKQQENKAFTKMLKEFPKAFGRVSFRERLMLRTAFDYVVEEVIADIKANCDLAIEGRDVKIKELELELTVEKDQHQEEINLHLHAEDYIKSLEKENAELKMKIYGGGYEMIITKKDADIILLKKENAELKHNKKTVVHLADCLEEKMKERIEELEQQIEKLIDFVLSKTECCDICPITDTCINSEGTCPYAGILAKGEEEVTREWLMQKIAKEIKENEL